MITVRQDRIEHWAFGFVLTLFFLINPWFIFLGIAFALGKEAYDNFYGNGADGWDIVATIAGVIVAWIFLVVML